MSNYRFFTQITIVFCLIFLNFIPFFSLSNFAEFGAPDGTGHTTQTWYIDGSDDVSYSNKEFWTMDITINNSGKMTWDNVSAYIKGNVTVGSDGLFTLTNCFLNLSGDFSINGIANFDNVTLVMNSSTDGEYGINVTKSGTFNILNNSNITAYDKTTPIDVDTTTPGNESWGLHYNFTVHGNLTINNSFISYTYGNRNYFGGIHLYETADASITNSTIFEHEVSGIYAEGNTTHVFRNNHIYNITRFCIYLIDNAIATIEDNTIESFDTNDGFGIVCIDHSGATINRNTIRNNRFDGIYLTEYSNATINDNIIENNQRAGIVVLGVVYSATPFRYHVCDTKITNNTITNNFEWGIANLISPMDVINNTITHTTNSSGIWIQSHYYTTANRPLGVNVPGNIINNTLKYNNMYGINLSSQESVGFRGRITMTIRNNAITNNNWSGINVMGETYQGTQYSPQPTIEENSILYNNHSGVRNYRAVGYSLVQNTIEYNNMSGVLCLGNSYPQIRNNYNISWNGKYGIETKASSRPTTDNNSITHNSDSGISMDSATVTNQIFDNIISYNIGHGLEISRAVPNIHDNIVSYNNHSGVYIQGASSASIVNTNDVIYNSWSGIELNSSSVQIRNNNITNNTQDGIKVTGGAPTVNQNNIVSYNGWHGLACYQSAQPVVDSTVFRFNGKSGIYSTASNLRVGTGAGEVLISDNTEFGFSGSASTTGTITAKILSNTKAGVYITGSGSNPIFINSIISANGENGVNATSASAPEFINSTISDDNTGEAFWLDGSADPVAVNSTFTDTNVYFKDTTSSLTVKWFVNIRTVSNADSSPVPNCNVTINSTTQPAANPLFMGLSNVNGQINWLQITEFIASDANNDHRATGNERVAYSPVDVSGEAFNFRDSHVLPAPTIDHSQTIILGLDPNRQPGLVSNILPIYTHNLQPTITWDPAIDLDPGQTIIYNVWLGTIQNASNIFSSPEITGTSYTIPADVLQYDQLDGNKSYHLTIVSNDQHGGLNYTFHKIYILNNKPSKPSINLTLPEAPTELLNLVSCEITVPSVDPDGDDINYTYKWFKNGLEQTALRLSDTKDLMYTISTLTDGIEFKKGEEWEVQVYANDGLPFGRSSYQNAIFIIGNLGPTVTQEIADIVMKEDTSKKGIIDLTQVFNDVDQASLNYVITVDNPNLTVTEDKLTHKVDIEPSSNWNGEATINFTCIDSEGLFATQIVKVTVTPENDVPEFLTIGAQPWQPGRTFRFSDDDGAIENKWFNITISASDADVEFGEADEVTFQANTEEVTLTQWVTNPLNATLSFLPKNDHVGFYYTKIFIKDSTTNFIHATTLEIQVKNVNNGPSLVSIMKFSGGEEYFIPDDGILDLIGKITVKEGQQLTLRIIANDPDLDHDDDYLTFFTDNADITTMDSNTGEANTAKLQISAVQDSVGLLVFNITVKDQQGEESSAQIKFLVENVNDAPEVEIIKPAVKDKKYFDDDIINFEGEAKDPDVDYGDELNLTWSSNIDGVLGYGPIINVSLSADTHIISFRAEDLFGEAHYVTTTVIIEEALIIDDDEPKEKGDETNMVFLGIISAMIIIIVVMLLVLFLVFRSKKKQKDRLLLSPGPGIPPKSLVVKGPPTDQAAGAGSDAGETAPGQPTTMAPSVASAETGLPTSQTATGAALPGLGADQGATPKLPPAQDSSASGDTEVSLRTSLDQPYVPTQIMTCPKCSQIMSFSPDGSSFCIRCGYKPDK